MDALWLIISKLSLEHVLTFWHYKMFQAHLVYFLLQFYHQPILQRSFDFFYQKIIFETTFSGLCALVVSGMSLLLGPLHRMSSETHACDSVSICSYFSHYPSVSQDKCDFTLTFPARICIVRILPLSSTCLSLSSHSNSQTLSSDHLPFVYLIVPL